MEAIVGCAVCRNLVADRENATEMVNGVRKARGVVTPTDRTYPQLYVAWVKADERYNDVLVREEQHWQEPEHHNAFGKNRYNPNQ
jgi:hypothetical protein